MAGIGLYGVYYSKATIADGVVTGYAGVQQMGKAISASFEQTEPNDNPLFANNGIAEHDSHAGSGGTVGKDGKGGRLRRLSVFGLAPEWGF